MSLNRSELVEQDAMSLSFVGCGFLSFYYLGVTACLRKYSQINEKTIICGVSSGTVASLSLCLDLSLGDSTEQMLELAKVTRSRPLGLLHPSCSMNKMIYEGLNKILPDDCHKKASGRLHIGMTRVSDGENVIISQFDSKEELIKVVQCSSFIPLMSGISPPKYKGIAYIDGGLSNNSPKLNDNTVTVSPWTGEFDICPMSDTSIPNEVMFYNKLISLSPTNLHRMSQVAHPPAWPMKTVLSRQGFEDTLRFLLRSNRISHSTCLISQPSFTKYEELAEYNSNSVYVNNRSNDENNSYVICIECQNKTEVSVNDSIPEVIVKVIDEAYHHYNQRIVNRFLTIKLLFILSTPLLLMFEWISAFILGVIQNEWSFQEFINIMSILKIIIKNGLVGKYHKIS